MPIADGGDSIVQNYNSGAGAMTSRRSNRTARSERQIFDSIRKPLAPPGHPMTHAKPEEKARPAGRKAKHKNKLEETNEREER